MGVHGKGDARPGTNPGPGIVVICLAFTAQKGTRCAIFLALGLEERSRGG
ncbi:MAG: hypothetical protein Fur0021_15820 [Candidatus Promineifilaceae bacterium]